MDTTQSNEKSQTQNQPPDEGEMTVNLFPRMSSKHFEPMTKESTKLFAEAMFAEFGAKKDGVEIPIWDKSADDMPPLTQILMKRIEHLQLPIKFTQPAAIGFMALAPNPGKTVVLLIECLQMYEGKVIDMEKLSHLYPAGFYNEETLATVIDKYMKTRKAKWSWVYGSRH